MAEEARASLKLHWHKSQGQFVGEVGMAEEARASLKPWCAENQEKAREVVGMAEEARASLKLTTIRARGFLHCRRNGGRGSCEFETILWSLSIHVHIVVGMAEEARASLKRISPRCYDLRSSHRRNGGRGSCEFETSYGMQAERAFSAASEWRK